MNCCDEYGDCRRGRDCPARAPACKYCYGLGYDASGQRCMCQEPARPAKVGRRYPRHPKSQPWSPWRAYLRHLAKWMLIVIAVMFTAALVVGVAHA